MPALELPRYVGLRAACDFSWEYAMKVKLAFPVACLLLGATAAANASPYVVTLEQSGTNVVATGSGDIDLTGLSFNSAGPGGSSVQADIAYLTVGGGAIWAYEARSFSGPGSFGTGGFRQANSQLGPTTGIFGAGSVIYVPSQYTSDSDLSSSATWTNQTFATLGITPGSYKWTWGSGADQSFTLDAVAAATPLPAALPLFAGGLGVLSMLGWARKRKTAAI